MRGGGSHERRRASNYPGTVGKSTSMLRYFLKVMNFSK